MLANAFHSSTWETEIGKIKVQCQLKLHRVEGSSGSLSRGRAAATAAFPSMPVLNDRVIGVSNTSSIITVLVLWPQWK